MSLLPWDTNVLSRAAHPADGMHAQIRDYLVEGRMSGDRFAYTTQNAIALWNVLSRPISRNGYGLPPAAVRVILDRVGETFVHVPDKESVYAQWIELATRRGVSGANAHDARLAAVALIEGLPLVTLNGADFRRYAEDGLVIVDPV